MKGRKPGLKSTVWSRRKKETFSKKKINNKNSKNEERLRNLRTTLNAPTPKS